MIGWRLAYALGLVGFVALPLLMPFSGLTKPATWAWTADDADRLLHLALHTVTLTLATIALALPLGVGLAVLLFRTSFFGRRILVFLVALSLFVPLPVIVASWQTLLGADGLGFWRGSARLWATGLCSGCCGFIRAI